ncbi:winged helix DNA-binding domain-containing protein [Actinoplanes sp. ATCC 53533]|nr:winged helix DNA-binding domain-containing protein [Actinoplanes sp. ATCC 53533]RSM73265.1 winged helix DNA-binding domain-containing protein [Actinoplanes sp. ATCC 53533]
MRSLLLTPPSGRDDVAGIVEWFGAMQAQDMASGLWSLGGRLPGRTEEDVRAALERREAIRTWPMRGTVHLVPPADARWMLELMGTRVLAGAAKRRETIGLSEAAADRGVEILATILKGDRLTRAECLAALAEAGVELGPQMGYHLLWYASQRGVTCIAPHIGKEQTFVLLDEWAPQPNRPSRAEALGIIATRFFRSHGPATRADLVRWTGLTMTDVKAGVAAAGAALTTVRVGGTEMLVDPALLAGDLSEVADDWVALPGFDEYMLGYRDRTLMLDDGHLAAVVPGGNGVFRSTLVRGGRVVGTWTRTLGKKAVTIDIQPLVELGPAERARAEEALQPYAAFVGLPARISWAS